MFNGEWYYNIEDIKISLHVNAFLDTKNSMTCAIILNELMTNSFKYAFENNKEEIIISLNKIDNNYHFIVEDSGIGFDYEAKKESSFGLSFVKTMAEDELKGSISVDTKNGTKIEIIFSSSF